MTSSQAESQSRSEQKVNEVPSAFPNWTDDTVVIVATGPSLTAAQLHHLWLRRKTVKIIAINEAGLRRCLPLSVPYADVLYAADSIWWRHYQPEFAGLRISGEVVLGVETMPLKMLERDQKMPHTPGTVVSAGHSGFQALGLALSLGASRILLLGFDAGPAKNGKRHCQELDKRTAYMNRESPYSGWREHYNRVPVEFPNVEIINCSPLTHITAFPVANIEDVLCK